MAQVAPNMDDNHHDLEPLSIAYYCTGHGLGHATRAIEVCKALALAGHSVVMVTGAPASAFRREISSPTFSFRKAVLDYGAKQFDAFSVDMAGSLAEYHRTAVAPRAALVATEADWLSGMRCDLVMSDVVPIACAAAAAADVPCVCVTNFSWDFIYSEYLTAVGGSDMRRVVWQIAEDYSEATALLRLPGYSPMPAFRHVVDVPLVVRHARRGRDEVREALGVPPGHSLVVFMYGGQPAGDWDLREEYLPPGWHCVVCSGGKPPGGKPLPRRFALARADDFTPDLVNAADCVLGKIGYGSTSECLAHRVPLIFVRRDYFNEEPFLRKLLELHGAAIEMRRRDFLHGNWGPFLKRAQALRVKYDEPTNGAEVVARLAVGIARRQLDWETRQRIGGGGEGGAADQGCCGEGRARLRDTIIWGYMMQRHSSRDRISIPEWYTRGQLPTSPGSPASSPGSSASSPPRPASPAAPRGPASNHHSPTSTSQKDSPEAAWHTAAAPAAATAAAAAAAAAAAGGGVVAEGRAGAGAAAAAKGEGGGAEAVIGLEAFEVVGGKPLDVATYPDTARFLGTLAQLDDTPPDVSGAHELPERRAARGLFRWEDEVLVARAPGRLDVMGGIADYSGALVLQLPLAQAAHVAVQSHPPGRQRLWRHMQARHDHLGGRPRPALRVVSFNADITNRGPTFDLDLSELQDPTTGRCMTYEQAREYFGKDPAHSWAAYVAGALLVMARECGADLSALGGLSVLVASDVPEGKGVSSSAAVEVATMTAMSAALGVPLEPRQLALLCQKVENYVVGAPCGPMDQMASALGQAGKLLALRCQPAELVGWVDLPGHIRLWGVDSGIRHSVGSGDYPTVRAATFMGLRIIADLAQHDADLAQQNAMADAASPSQPSPSQQQQQQWRTNLAQQGAAAGAASPSLSPPSPSLPSPLQQQQQQQQWAPNSPSLSRSSSARPPLSGVGWDQGRAAAPGGGYLANLSVSEFEARYEARLPDSLTGEQFTRLHPAGHLDEATKLVPHKMYPVRQATKHAVCEAARVRLFHQLLQAPGSDEQLRLLGELMLQSHDSYGRCGLGSSGTDAIVELVKREAAADAGGGVQQQQPQQLFGAKITGGGCGGTVVIMGRAGDAGDAAARRVVEQYSRDTSYCPDVYSGSSPGAAALGCLRVRRRPGR